MNKCRVITKAGKRCKNGAVAGSGSFCHIHLKQAATLFLKTKDATTADKPSRILELLMAAAGVAALAQLVLQILERIDFFETPHLYKLADCVYECSSRVLRDLQQIPEDSLELEVLAQELDSEVAGWIQHMPNEAITVIFEFLSKDGNDREYTRADFESELRTILLTV